MAPVGVERVTLCANENLYIALGTCPDQAALAVPGGCGCICSFIFCFISFAVGSALWVPSIHVYPSGSMIVPHRSPQNMSITGPWPVAPRLRAFETTLSTFSTYRNRVAGEAPTFLAVRLPHAAFSGPSMRVVPRKVSSA